MMVPDHLDLLRQALTTVLMVGLSADVSDARACLDRLASVDASIKSASAGLRRHTLSHITLLAFSAARAVIKKMVNLLGPENICSQRCMPRWGCPGGFLRFLT